MTLRTPLRLAAAVAAVVVLGGQVPGAAPTVRPAVVAEVPHDADAWTQGLVWVDAVLYESAGGRGRSTLRRVDPATGAVVASRPLGPALFAEGLAAVGDRLVQLTWTAGLALVWDRAALAPVDTLRYEGQGWGLAADGDLLVMSDGSDRLVWRDPATFAAVREVAVRDGDVRIAGLNELEVVDGLVFANVQWTSRIAAIDPSGAVVYWLDLADAAREHRTAGDLNGVAYDAATDRLVVTGKLWPRMLVLDGFRPADDPGARHPPRPRE